MSKNVKKLLNSKKFRENSGLLKKNFLWKKIFKNSEKISKIIEKFEEYHSGMVNYM